MAINWNEVEKRVDLKSLENDIRNAKDNNQRNYEEVPCGDYEVTFEKLELSTSKSGEFMVVAWMRIVSGDFKNSVLFLNQVINEGWKVDIVCDFINSLGSDVDFPKNRYDFPSYREVEQLLMDIHEAIDGKFEYAVKYGKTKSDFPTYEIKEVFELE